MRKGEVYVRGEDGPAFEVTGINESSARLRATTTITGHFIEASTADIPYGWFPCSNRVEREKLQKMLAAQYSRRFIADSKIL